MYSSLLLTKRGDSKVTEETPGVIVAAMLWGWHTGSVWCRSMCIASSSRSSIRLCTH